MSNTEFEPTEAPRDVSIERSKSQLYEELQESDGSPFQGAQRMEIFLFAMAYGSKKTGKTSLKGDRQALFNVSSLKNDQKWLVKSVAVRDARTTEVLQDGKQIYQIAQEYANSGLEELHGKVVGPGDALTEISTDLIKLSQNS